VKAGQWRGGLLLATNGPLQNGTSIAGSIVGHAGARLAAASLLKEASALAARLPGTRRK